MAKRYANEDTIEARAVKEAHWVASGGAPTE